MSDYYNVVIDPDTIAVNRVPLSLNDAPINIGGTSSGQGVDWGENQITEYLAEQGTYGSTVSDYVVPNRTVTIPLGAGTDPQADTVEDALDALREKVGLLQREGGWLMRQRAGGKAMYSDIVSATLDVPDDWAETAGIEAGITLTLETLPDWYGDEIALDTLDFTDSGGGALVTLDSAAADIDGDGPARVRLVITDTSGNDQLGLLWGLQSRYYDDSATAALTYEAEALTPLNGGAILSAAGASGGDVIEITDLSAGVWTPMLMTALLAGSNLTHQGTFRIWARCKSSTGTPQLRLCWGVGSLSAPETNQPAALPGSGAFYMLDLGVVRLDAPPVGDMEWIGSLQVYSAPGGDNMGIDELFLQPLDDGAGQCSYLAASSSSVLSVSAPAGAGADSSAVGTRTWSGPGNITALDGAVAAAGTPGTSGGFSTHYLEASEFGFAIPSTATILGIEATIYRSKSGALLTVSDQAVQLIKAGTVEATSRATGATWSGSITAATLGGPTDLWGTSWAPADINDSGFGVALEALLSTPGPFGGAAYVDYMTITVYYELASGFTVAPDAVVYADEISELRTDGCYRTPGSDVYGPISQVIGDLPRLPASGLEGRPCRLFLRVSRGDLDTLPDSGLDTFTAQVIYRPYYSHRP